jgi:CRISPR-associated endoribonuclease Cas6
LCYCTEDVNTIMRVRIVFNLTNKGSYLPYYHQFLLAQTIKAVLLAGGNEEHINYPHYHFSGVKGQTRISRHGLHYLSNKVTLVVASPNQAFIDYFLKSLFAHKEIEIGNLQLIPFEVEKEAKPEFNDEAKFICISPMVITQPSLFEETGKQFVYPESDEFSDILYENTIQRMYEFGFEDEQLTSFYKFQIVPDAGYLQKIKDANKKFARIYPVYDQDVKYDIRGYTFPFTLYAAKEVIDFVFTCGLGLYSQKGFGMLDLANADPVSRSEKYEHEQLVNQ